MAHKNYGRGLADEGRRVLTVLSMNFRPLLLLAGAVALLASPVLRAQPAASATGLMPDPAVRFGRLDNGLRYAVLANAEPKGRASVRLYVGAGAFAETEEQRGLAHFLEHMAFNGSTHYAPGTLVEFFQRMGMSFGGDTNAFTSFDRTQYMLELADTKEATLAEGFQVLSDYAGGLLLLAPEIDKERGIIASEKRARDSVAFRTQIAGLEFALKGTRLPERLPIGLSEVIAGAPRERFVDFYDTWYRPELMAVIAVGDFDAAAVEKQIAARFAGLKPRAPAKPAPDLGRVAEGPQTGFHAEPEAASTTISISLITGYTPEPDTAANRLKRLPRSIAFAMLNRRFSVLAKKEGAPFVSASASAGEMFRFIRQASVDVTSPAATWAAALAVGEQELRRALEHGFQAGELAEVKAAFLNSLQQAVKTAATRRSPDLANGLADALHEDEVFTTPAADLALYEPALAKVTLADCLAAFREAWTGAPRRVFVAGNAVIPGDAPAAIAAAYAQSAAVAVAAPAAEQTAAWAYTDFGPAGTVTKREHVADLDLTLVTFANGVRLNLKKTDFEAGRIGLSARVGDGAVTEPATQRGLASLAGGTFTAGGLGKHSTDDLRRLLAGKNVGVRFAPSSDAFVFSGGTTPDDLLLQLQLMTAYLTDPGYRPEALRQAQKGIEQMYLGFAHTVNGPMATEVANLIAGGDPRFGVPAKEVMLSRTLDEVKAWLAPQFAQGAIELAVVGDLDVDATIAAVAKTLGALPPRAPKPALAELKKVAFPAQPFTRDYTIQSELPKGAVTLYWPTTDASDVRRTRRLSLLGSVFSDRLRVKIREEMGGTYSPRAGSMASDTFPGYGYISTSIDVAPDTADRVAEAALSLADDLAKNGVSADEHARALQPLLTSAKESLRNNGYWLGSVLSRAQEKPEVLDWARTRLADLEAMKPEELSALAKEYLSAARASRVTILPAAK